MVMRVERIAKAGKVIIRYNYKPIDDRFDDSEKEKKKKQMSFKKILHKAIEKSNADNVNYVAPYKVEIDVKNVSG